MAKTEDRPSNQAGPHLLAKVVRARREALGLTQDQVVELGGPSLGTQRSVENARADRYQPKTLHAIDDTLGWTRGTSLALLGKNSAVNIARRINEFDLDAFTQDAIDGTHQKLHKSALRLTPANAPASDRVVFASAGLAMGHGTAGSPAVVTADTTVTAREPSFGDRIAGLDRDDLIRLRDFIDGALYRWHQPELDGRVAHAAMEIAEASERLDNLRKQQTSIREETGQATARNDPDALKSLHSRARSVEIQIMEAESRLTMRRMEYHHLREVQDEAAAKAAKYAEGMAGAEHGEAPER
ncbi:helix-turn-helix domain-containing protein [Amycolatopsis mongoliensis]|uniref:Helix-turn-helix domain-containing protein n=1 Tax=Amycolatopsis mongoliensis TaxID=715475 RepID=A0A9Y2JXH4_9PSEU|nr:helix-turn-helix domain-containing protein [Amycolatopsis sp. 4-36]WIY05439.1 helix-turn-helix domain-containing protein [Amycolatopsis sp. 4-36]